MTWHRSTGRQHVLGVGAARPARHPARTARRAGRLGRADGDGPGLLLPNSCCCSGDGMVSQVLLHRAGRRWSRSNGWPSWSSPSATWPGACARRARNRLRRTTRSWSCCTPGCSPAACSRCGSATGRSSPRWAGRCWRWCSPRRRCAGGASARSAASGTPASWSSPACRGSPAARTGSSPSELRRRRRRGLRAAARARCVDHRARVHRRSTRGCSPCASAPRTRRWRTRRACMTCWSSAAGRPVWRSPSAPRGPAWTSSSASSAAGSIDKACGEGLMPGALRALRRLGVDPPGHDIRGITYRQGDIVAACAVPARPGTRRTAHRAARRAARAAVADRRPVLDRACAARSSQHADHVEAARRPRRATWSPPTGCTRRSARAARARARRAAGPPRWGLRRHFAIAPSRDSVEVTWAARLRGLRDAGRADDRSASPSCSSTRGGFDEQLAAFPDLAERLAAPSRSRRCAAPARCGNGCAAGRRTGAAGRRRRRLHRRAHRRRSRPGLRSRRGARRVPVRGRPDRYERAAMRHSRRSRWITSALLARAPTSSAAPRVVPLAARAPASSPSPSPSSPADPPEPDPGQ